ncbi:DWNN-domain-containing protein [Didymella exigua CBS 183.55]|uniref:DWNN-domain-containing protein n=1 Tax=Didymella exigua CBS 183.55 TaxID=1150837 RepID=A0A6A5RT40_9PLEO|nr:DWNN-domain-containing protein [Didymella exigua CBS 183.55]KAF1930284.1 DWNN-domain-containing protein [Didymella exigua CBS 183.55]
MSSSVFYKFKNSKEPERYAFDGNEISVFELKRAIIEASGMAKSTDLNLHIYHEDEPTKEYDDDTTTIPRTSTVIAVRRPAQRGFSKIARYVSGKPPVRAIKKDAPTVVAPRPNGGTETDAEAAFLAESAQVWDAQKESLSHAKPVYNKKKPVNVPNYDPPSGYVCRRCGVKGHWIQQCPENDNPDFKPVHCPKRTTGIPKSFLKVVDKSEVDEDAKGVMLNADGEYVQVMTDTKTWEKFQEKTQATKVQAANADATSKEVRERGLECPLDNRMFVQPVKTACCEKTYCNDCIESSLADNDLICPNCGEETLIEFTPDKEMEARIRDFEAEKAKEKAEAKAEKEAQAKAEVEAAEAAAKAAQAPTESDNASATHVPPNDKETSVDASEKQKSEEPTSDAESKKRKSPPTEIQPPTAPKAMRQQQQPPQNTVEQDFIAQMEALKNMPMGMPAMNMNMNMMGNGNGNGNGMMMPGVNGFNPMMGMNGFNPQTQMQMQQMQNMQMQNMQMQNMHNMPMMGMHGFHPAAMHGNAGAGAGAAANAFASPAAQHLHSNSQFNDAYDRQPVNPNRQRGRKPRAPDYRYL